MPRGTERSTVSHPDGERSSRIARRPVRFIGEGMNPVAGGSRWCVLLSEEVWSTEREREKEREREGKEGEDGERQKERRER
ncbi:hypothetical protein PUN28_004061 [Cardiocondyla obscurior]|uniref:Uncharacterized protein n=1 Tax=Cardiocondyla obscurior TaxID=286306 RepID=A0AAW2GPG3_9HYME